MNILVLMTDQQRHDALGCSGNTTVKTPRLDALASSGVRFDQACAATPICIASRHSFMTGRRASRHGWVANHRLPGPPLEWPTLMTLLRHAGYHTHAVGKMHFLGRHYGLVQHERMEECISARIDDDYLQYLAKNGVRTRFPQGHRNLLYYQPQTCGIPEEHSQNAWVARQAIHCLREHRRYRGEQPLFLWASWIAPHPPFAPCEPYDSIYEDEEIPFPVFANRPLVEMPSPTWPHRGRLDGAHLDEDRMRRIRSLYYGQVTHVDHCMGQVLDALDELNMEEDTVVLYLSDHGDMLGDHGLSQKNVPYEPSVRVPLVLRWPGRTDAGRVCHDLVGLTDLLPTFLRGLGLTYPKTLPPLPGEDLLGEQGGGLVQERDGYVVDFGDGPLRWVSLRTKTCKYVLWAAGGWEELYDLKADPWEEKNLVAEEPTITREMRMRVLAWEREYGLDSSFEGETWRVFPEPEAPTEETVRTVCLNEGQWADRLPEEECESVESFEDAFTRAIAKEPSLTPGKLSISLYRERGGHPLTGTPWENAWRQSGGNR